MAPPPERRWPWIAAGYAVLLTVVATVTSLAYDAAAPSDRLGLIRIAVVFFLAVTLLHVKKHFRGARIWEPTSAMDRALRAEPLPPKLDPTFTKLREEMANSRASQAYFESILWPRLESLAKEASDGAGIARTAPPRRRWHGRGPSLETLDALITRLERGA